MWRSSTARKRSEASIVTSKAVTSTSETFTSPPLPRPRGSRSTLTEVLRNNPFRSISTETLQDAHLTEPVRLLNQDLVRIASIYPDVQIDVLRELLLRFDGESRLQVCVEQLFRYKSEWAQGRLVNPSRDTDIDIPKEELFRSQSYIEACKRTLYNEFKNLNQSVVDAVLAEFNNDYARARPTLQEIAAKTWRATLTSFFRKKKANDEAPSFLVQRGKSGNQILSSTGNTELDAELSDLFLVAKHDQILKQQQTDYELANHLNFEQAADAGALFECQCCFDDVTFEQITTCAREGHVVCVECVRRTFSEAVFGQSWNKSIDTTLGTLQCFVPLASDQCPSHIQQENLRLAVIADKSGHEMWAKFEQRLATDSLNKSNLPLQACAFCPYAEIKEVHSLESAAEIRWHLRVDKSLILAGVGGFLLFFQLLILAFLAILLLVLFSFPVLSSQIFQQSLVNLVHQGQTRKFKCRSSQCGKKSCMVCHKQWHDPHICHEPMILSLRNTVEAARTAALKRVCPRCGMGFVKSSGCNKLVCVCGYAMCYLCRKNIGKVSPSSGEAAAGGGIAFHWNLNVGVIGRAQAQAQARVEDAEMIAAGEGYRHFCPHFRPLPGQKCTECDKCDLYKTEDEDAIVRRAGEIAEREWREKYEQDDSSQHRGLELKGLENALAGIDDRDYNYAWYLSTRIERTIWKVMSDLRRGRFSVQAAVDWVVERVVIIEHEAT